VESIGFFVERADLGIDSLCTVRPRKVSNALGGVRALIPVKASHPKMNAKMAMTIARIASGRRLSSSSEIYYLHDYSQVEVYAASFVKAPQ
jgi:hypothetical protein